MTTHYEPGNDMRDAAALGQFTLGSDTLYRCVCSTGPARLHLADERGRIVADPTWDQHRTITCSGCGRYGRSDPDDRAREAVPVLGIAPLPAGCSDCGAETAEPCRNPFCPGQDVLDPVDPDSESVAYSSTALLSAVPPTSAIWRYWASQAINPDRRDRAAELRSAVQATREAWRLRRGLRRGPGTIWSAALTDGLDINELMDCLSGRCSHSDQKQALFALRMTRGWGASVGADLIDAAAIVQAEGHAPF
ncbi:hypothetical protein [Pseudonocardia sp. ICBG1034]|uniref:hypothetical protein n=1 Tax=Pseudonocardia sp. ICBG1034 TaxID=2844381 RepID=UPI001CCAFD83|nr:hypothetical protein [Pseudonocardia sp. ICBG1034]